jgi:hypothetical protein
MCRHAFTSFILYLTQPRGCNELYLKKKKDTKKVKFICFSWGVCPHKRNPPWLRLEICEGRIGLLCSMSEGRLTKISPLSCLSYPRVAFKNFDLVKPT